MKKPLHFLSRFGRITMVVACSLTIVSCFDNELDVMNKEISTKVEIFGDGLGLPVGTTTSYTIAQFLEDEEIEGLEVATDGTYSYIAQDSTTETFTMIEDGDEIKIDGFNVSDNIDASLSDFSIENITFNETPTISGLSLSAISTSDMKFSSSSTGGTGSFSLGSDVCDLLSAISLMSDLIGNIDDYTSLSELLDKVNNLSPATMLINLQDPEPTAIAYALSTSSLLPSEISSINSITFDATTNEITITIDVSEFADLYSSGFGLRFPSITITLGNGFVLTDPDNGETNKKTFVNQEAIGNTLDLVLKVSQYTETISSTSGDVSGSITVDMTLPEIKGTIKSALTVQDLSVGADYNLNLAVSDMSMTTNQVDLPSVNLSSMSFGQSITVNDIPEYVSDVTTVTFDNSKITLSFDKINTSIFAFTNDSESLVISFPDDFKITELADNKLIIPASEFLGSGKYSKELTIESVDLTGSISGGTLSKSLDIKVLSSDDTSDYDLSIKGSTLTLSEYNNAVSDIGDIEVAVAGTLAVDDVTAKTDGASFDIDEVSEKISIAESLNFGDEVNLVINSLKRADFDNDIDVAISVELTNVPTSLGEITLSGVEIQLPKFIELTENVTEQGDYNLLSLDGEKIEPTSSGSTTRTYNKTITITGLDFSNYNNIVEGDSIKLDEKIKLTGSIAIADSEISLNGVENLSGSFSLSSNDFVLSSITADLSATLSESSTTSLVLAEEIDDFDELKDELKFEVVLDDPYVELSAKLAQPMAMALSLDSFDINVHYPNKQDDWDIEVGKLSIDASKENKIRISDNMTSTDGFTDFNIGGLNKLLSKGFPDSLSLNASSLCIPSKPEGYTISLVKGEQTIEYGYKVVVPIGFKSLDISYYAEIEDLNVDLSELGEYATSLALNLTAKSTLPVGIKIEDVVLYDVDGELITTDVQLVDRTNNSLKANSTSTITLTLDTDLLMQVDKIGLELTAYSTKDAVFKSTDKVELGISAILKDGLTLEIDE